MIQQSKSKLERRANMIPVGDDFPEPYMEERERRPVHGTGLVIVIPTGLLALAGLWHLVAWWFQ